MFRHTGKKRTFLHNLKLASMLSGVAGLVNITGVLSLGTLTTNITGHFAFFAERLFLKSYAETLTYLFYIVFFLFGAFFSSLLIELVAKRHKLSTYVLPILVEILLLTTVGLADSFVSQFSVLLACLLLFAMGLQNALVTRVSQSVVRTTHLTGLFTDLGIELSQLLFYREPNERAKLKRAIFLKVMIITCFFSGGIIGGFVHIYFGLKTLLLAALLLLFALWYDRLLFRYYYLKRKLSGRYTHP
ncbi:YoaK family protein [Fluviicola sp.]|uniref:YoaK family protein n=1 Tax=Fluviicola sp. TaxID=1917219 RepID=UPI0031CE53F5